MPSSVVRLISPEGLAKKAIRGFLHAASVCTALLALAACERGTQQAAAGASEIDWARAALERNPRIEVVASDPQSGVFTIRDRNSGEVQVVKLNEIAAAPASQLAAKPAAAAAPESAAAPRADESADALAASDAQQSDAPAEAADDPRSAAATAAQPATTSSAADDPANYTIERSDGQLRVSGPGVSIVSSGAPSAGDGLAPSGRRAAEPIICEGRRMVHLDDRDMYVDGDAITVRDGCEMFITNSRIVASGTGVVVRDAVVHVSNSHIEGAENSFDIGADSEMYVRGSTFEGLSRRDELAMVQDQGGNRWR